MIIQSFERMYFQIEAKRGHGMIQADTTHSWLLANSCVSNSTCQNQNYCVLCLRVANALNWNRIISTISRMWTSEMVNDFLGKQVVVCSGLDFPETIKLDYILVHCVGSNQFVIQFSRDRVELRIRWGFCSDCRCLFPYNFLEKCQSLPDKDDRRFGMAYSHSTLSYLRAFFCFRYTAFIIIFLKFISMKSFLVFHSHCCAVYPDADRSV